VKKADVYVYTTKLSPEQIEGAHLKFCSSVGRLAAELAAKVGTSKATICVLPEGPQTIPYYEA
jgi:hypothetical protein